MLLCYFWNTQSAEDIGRHIDIRIRLSANNEWLVMRHKSAPAAFSHYYQLLASDY